MSDLARKIEDLRAHVRVDWSDERARAAERGMHGKRRRRALVRASAIALAVLALIAFPLARGVFWKAPAAVATNATNAPSDLAIEAGTTIARLAPDAIVKPVCVTAERVELTIEHGGAHFDVARNPSRLFRIVSGDVAVEVIGTAFEVERVGDRTRVAVERGRVRVLYGAHKEELGAGENGLFPRAESAQPAPLETGEPVVVGAPHASAALPPAPSAQPTWKSLARDGDYDKAYEALSQAGPSAVRDEPGELLLAADVARLSKHASEAVAPLRRVVQSYPGDPRAPLAAFTLGRVLLDQLGRAREAADMFAKARALGGGGLGEDALAREVEASSRAGDAERARRLAEEYVQKFPNGPRKRSVVKFGGLE